MGRDAGVLWYVLEAVYALVLGFPWLELSGALAAWPLLVQGADAIGSYALAGLWTTIALWCGLALLPHPAQTAPAAEKTCVKTQGGPQLPHALAARMPE